MALGHAACVRPAGVSLARLVVVVCVCTEYAIGGSKLAGKARVGAAQRMAEVVSVALQVVGARQP